MNLFNQTFKPMLLQETSKPFNSSDYIYEVKYDGIRALIYVNPHYIKIISRNKKDITSLFPELKIITTLVKHNVIFDGEIIIDDNGKPSFSKLQQRLHLTNHHKINNQLTNNPVKFIAFDILYDNKDLTNIPLIKRKELLNKYPDNDIFIKSFYINYHGIKLFNKIKKLNLEGIVAKKIDSIYFINQRSDNWLKIKNYHTDYFYIGGYELKNSNYIITILLGEYINNKFYYVGKIILSKKDNLYTKIINSKVVNNPFINYPYQGIFIKPLIKIKISYIERTNHNYLRGAFK